MTVLLSLWHRGSITQDRTIRHTFEPRDLTFEQSESSRRLSHQTMAQLELRRKLIELSGARQELESEKTKSNELLLNILPAKIAEELKNGNEVEPKYYKSATIMFTDFQGFTRFAEASEPRTLVNDLNQYFSAFDEIIERHNLEKLKTIGDAYMCAGGLPEENRSHPVDACLAALEIQEYMSIGAAHCHLKGTDWNTAMDTMAAV